MTGPEHYREAERLLDTSDPHAGGGIRMATRAALAQVHATLALAAATAAETATTYDGDEYATRSRGWASVA